MTEIKIKKMAGKFILPFPQTSGGAAPLLF